VHCRLQLHVGYCQLLRVETSPEAIRWLCQRSVRVDGRTAAPTLRYHYLCYRIL